MKIKGQRQSKFVEDVSTKDGSPSTPSRYPGDKGVDKTYAKLVPYIDIPEGRKFKAGMDKTAEEMAATNLDATRSLNEILKNKDTIKKRQAQQKKQYDENLKKAKSKKAPFLPFSKVN